MDANFKGKTVVITGGSAGVGAAAARRFANAGANLVLAARSKKNLDKIAEELRPITKVLTVAMDVADADACVNLFKKAEFEFGQVNVLVNNAGVHTRGAFEPASLDDVAAMIDVNLKAPIILSKVAIPYLRETGDAAIINVGSLAGRTPVPGAAVYSAAKFGLRAFTYALADELQDANIKLGVVSPGPIETDSIMANLDVVTDLTLSQPMSTAEEVANEIVRLCSNDKRERAMPALSGILTTWLSLVPALGKLLRPMLEARGRRVKRALKSKVRAAEREAST